MLEAKPNPKKFKLAFRGYDIDEVDEYIEKNTVSADVMTEQKERIFRLVDENKRLEAELAEMKKAQANVSGALLFANEKSAEIIADAKKLADAEMERVRIFKSKWEFFANKILGELAPAQRQTYARLSQRIDETLGRFSDETEKTKLAAMTVQQKQKTPQKVAVDKNVSVEKNQKPTLDPVIGLDEVYNTDESLENLLDDLI